VIVVDTSLIYALLDAADRRHRQAVGWYRRVDDELVTTPLVLAEANHLASTRLGPRAAKALRSDIRAGAYSVEWWPGAASAAAEVADRYAELGVGLVDASLVVLAARVGTVDIATFDERHFRALKPLTGAGSFRVLPADA